MRENGKGVFWRKRNCSSLLSESNLKIVYHNIGSSNVIEKYAGSAESKRNKWASLAIAAAAAPQG